ncbi:MAG: hypothetical protein IPK07_02565 [Deltaproteobacteria bacterium]|nr:hypothetical protein [Deltaproteobacteria bacterium]
MMRRNRLALASAIAVVLAFAPHFACAGAQCPGYVPLAQPMPQRSAHDRTAIGLEYVFIDQHDSVPVHAAALAEMGLTAVKHYPEHVMWGEMQSGPKDAIDFRRLDDYVREYQRAGFGDLVICLRANAKWAARSPGLVKWDDTNPKPEHYDAYEKWIQSVVERYDGDGSGDLPGLRWPVRYLEIGSEFSSYEPGPVAHYLETLKHAYAAAHRASASVLVAHAAFMPTTAFKTRPAASVEAYRAAFQKIEVDPTHGLDDIWAILDQPALFDVANFHALADPAEVEDTVRWLEFEMGRRGYRKPIMISDTFATPFIAWGPATSCDGPRDKLGKMIPPAVESDRCRLAQFFSKLVADDDKTLRWTRGFVAEDAVQRAIVSAEQGVRMVNLAYTTDLPFLTSRLLRAGAGLTAWAGFVELKGKCVDKRNPVFYATKQMMGHLRDYQGVQRISYPDPQVRAYQIRTPGAPRWVAWLDPGRVVLPGDEVPRRSITLPVGASHVTVEPVVNAMGQTAPERTGVPAPGGRVEVTLTPRPVFVVAGS